MHARFDRLILETASTFRRAKRRKTENKSHVVFLKLLDLKDKNKFRAFTRTFRRFALITKTKESVEQLDRDIENIRNARESITRLESQRLIDKRRSLMRI